MQQGSSISREMLLTSVTEFNFSWSWIIRFIWLCSLPKKNSKFYKHFLTSLFSYNTKHQHHKQNTSQQCADTILIPLGSSTHIKQKPCCKKSRINKEKYHNYKKGKLHKPIYNQKHTSCFHTPQNVSHNLYSTFVLICHRWWQTYYYM